MKCYFTVKIPWSARPTKWHPTESSGPFATLTRGSFPTKGAARAWARRHLRGQRFQVGRVCIGGHGRG